MKVNIGDYAHSPAHYHIVTGNTQALVRLISTLPSLPSSSQIHTVADAALHSSLLSRVSAVLDRRDVPLSDTPLHLSVRLNLPSAASLLLLAGADPSLQNSSGWTPLQESLSLRRPRRLSLLLLRHHRLSAFRKFRLRLPYLARALSQIPDFYLELSFHFDSSLIPFLSKAAPSDTYRIWKRGADLRADTTLAGFDGLRVRRADQTFLFLEGSKSLSVLNRGRKEVRDAFEGVECVDEGEGGDGEMVEDASAYRPGLDVTKVEMVKVVNWRRKEKVEVVGEWRAKVYEMNNVVFSFKTLKAVDLEEGGDEMMELELDEEAEEGYIVAEIAAPPRMRGNFGGRHSCYERGREEMMGVVDARRKSLDVDVVGRGMGRGVEEGWERRWENVGVEVGRRKEKEMVKNLKPVVWLTEDFPLRTEELIPILDILANKVKAVRRLRELLTSKFPAGTFPVKVSIPVVPTVRVVVTFTKFVSLQQPEQFFTPLSSPRHFAVSEEEEHRKEDNGAHKSSWLRWTNSSSSSAPKSSIARSKSISPSQVVNHVDPFAIPNDYTWVSTKDKSQRTKRSKSRKGK